MWQKVVSVIQLSIWSGMHMDVCMCVRVFSIFPFGQFALFFSLLHVCPVSRVLWERKINKILLKTARVCKCCERKRTEKYDDRRKISKVRSVCNALSWTTTSVVQRRVFAISITHSLSPCVLRTAHSTSESSVWRLRAFSIQIRYFHRQERREEFESVNKVIKIWLICVNIKFTDSYLVHVIWILRALNELQKSPNAKCNRCRRWHRTEANINFFPFSSLLQLNHSSCVSCLRAVGESGNRSPSK